MPYTRTTARTLIRYFFILIVAVLIVTYAVLRSINYTRGPAVDIAFPRNGEATSSPIVEIYGRAERASSITIDGRLITVDEDGNFSEVLVVFPGVNVVSFEARDQFGRATKKQISLFGQN